MGKKATQRSVAPIEVDPTLDALFASSAGPVKAPPKSRYSSTQAETPGPKNTRVDQGDAERDDDDDDDEEELDSEDDSEDNDESSQEYQDAPESMEEAKEAQESSDSDHAAAGVELGQAKPKRERKRKRKDDNADLEDRYLAKLSNGDADEPSGKRQKNDEAAGIDGGDEDDDDAELPKHESLTDNSKSSELEKANRTVFLANVSSEAISSKSAKKNLLAHLSSVLGQDSGDKVESIRFRSVAFATGAMPKKAAYITKQLMDATTKSTNAYVVYSSPTAARKAAAELNGSEILGRHMRIDSVSHPSPTDHRRCVFVGNLGFVDDESVLNTNEEGETVKKKRNKAPSDIEEGLWRTFGKHGKVENVRVVRDPKTRVGKGFAYVQFYDGNSVESALLLDGKKFPPMLPRALRVTRAKDPRKTNMAIERQKEKLNSARADAKNTRYKPKFTPEEKSQAGRARKLLGRAGAVAERRRGEGKEDRREARSTAMKTPEDIVFEGTRASAKNGRPGDLKFGKKAKGKSGKPSTRSARRATEWKKKKN